MPYNLNDYVGILVLYLSNDETSEVFLFCFVNGYTVTGW